MAITHDNMSPDEAALRTAINVLRDSVECGRMPSGLPLEPLARAAHESAIDHLDALLCHAQAGEAQ